MDYIVKKIARQVNAHLPAKEHIEIHLHLLRHTMLRKVADGKGTRYAMEFAGHVLGDRGRDRLFQWDRELLLEDKE